jgi:hypothetical protein
LFSRKKHPEIVFTIDLRNEKINKQNATRIRKGAQTSALFFPSTSYRNEIYYYVKENREANYKLNKSYLFVYY